MLSTSKGCTVSSCIPLADISTVVHSSTSIYSSSPGTGDTVSSQTLAGRCNLDSSLRSSSRFSPSSTASYLLSVLIVPTTRDKRSSKSVPLSSTRTVPSTIRCTSSSRLNSPTRRPLRSTYSSSSVAFSLTASVQRLGSPTSMISTQPPNCSASSASQAWRSCSGRRFSSSYSPRLWACPSAVKRSWSRFC